MNNVPQLSHWLEQGRSFLEQNASNHTEIAPVILAVLVLVAGIGMSVLGAKLSRVGMTVGFALLGGALAINLCQSTELPPAVCGLGGALLLGTVGFLTFRLWVGVVVGLVVAVLAVGTFGYQRYHQILPEFQESRLVGQTASLEDGPVIPTEAQQQANLARTPDDVAREFWSFVEEKNPGAQNRLQTIGGAALLLGLFFGVIAARWALIFATGVVGTLLVTAGALGILTDAFPKALQAFGDHPGLSGAAMGAFLLSSFILQTMLTRKAPGGKQSKKPAAETA